MATLMLEGGADVRFVQEMLGHENIQSTQIYTRVSIQKLREVHAATHPAAKLTPRAERVIEASDASGNDETCALAAAGLLAELDAESDDAGA